MAAALDTAWSSVELSGAVVTRYGHAVPAGRIEIIEASHPVPDEMSLEAANRILASVTNLTPDDLVIALISGGGSSLLVSPAGNMTLADKRVVNQALLASGATISEMNTVRKQLSNIKGGRLAQAAYPAKVVSLVISDVPGDDPSEIASGPTVANDITIEDAREIVARYKLELPIAAQEVLARGGSLDASRPMNTEVRLIASPSLALDAAADVARANGLRTIILGDALEGESREVGTVFSGIARSAKTKGLPIRGPALILSGRDFRFIAERIYRARRSKHRVSPQSRNRSRCATGYLGHGRRYRWYRRGRDAAGAIVTPDTILRMRQAGIAPRAALSAHDSYTAFKAIGDLVVTGPTLTNVNDIRAILIG